MRPFMKGQARAAENSACQSISRWHTGDLLRTDVPDVDCLAGKCTARTYRNARAALPVQTGGWDEMAVRDPSGNKLIYCTARSG